MVVEPRPDGWGVGGHEGPSAILRCTFNAALGGSRDRSGFGCARPGDDDGRYLPARLRLADPGPSGHRPGRPADDGIWPRCPPGVGVRDGSPPLRLLGGEPRRSGAVRVLRPRLLRRLHARLSLRPVGRGGRRHLARWRGGPHQAPRDPDRRRPRVRRVPDGAGPRRHAAARAHRGGRGPRQPDHLVRLGDLGPGRQLRHGVPAAVRARAVEGAPRAGRDPRRHRGPGQAAARDPRADRGVRDDPPRPVAQGRLGRRAARRSRRGSRGSATRPASCASSAPPSRGS